MRPALVLLTALSVACGGSAAGLQAAPLPVPGVIDSAPVSADIPVDEAEVSMEVIELMCRPCASQIVGKSRLLPGVTHVSMVLASKTLTIRFDRSLATREQVIASVEQIVASVH